MYGQFLGRDFNPLAQLLLLRTSDPNYAHNYAEYASLLPGYACFHGVRVDRNVRQLSLPLQLELLTIVFIFMPLQREAMVTI